ncbi:MAG: hypothetical protein AB1512_27250 [Thermodesulfobacteriota bacterium]
MNRDKAYFAAGLVIGVILTGLFMHYLAPRYTMARSGDMVIKHDTWTGESWRLVDNDWRIIRGVTHDWEKIDRALRAALHIPFAEVNVESALKTLKGKHAILQDLSDEELSERIKVVYSKYVLINLYLDSFLKLQGQPGKGEK